MATNRYTQLTPASFNPLSMEEILAVPLAKQQRHDQLQMAAMQEGMFDNPFLDTDMEVVQTGISEIKDGLTSIEDELATKGISRGLTRKMLELKRRKQEFLSPTGIGGKAAANYTAYHQNVKDIMDNKNASMSDKADQIRAAKQRYDMTGGVAEGANYNPYQGFDSYNIPEFLMDVGENLEPFITQTSGWRKSQDGTYWTNGTTKTTTLPLEVVENALMSAAASNPDLVDYLARKAEINPTFDPMSVLATSVKGAAPQFVQYGREYSEDMKFTPSGQLGGFGGRNTSFRPNTLNPGTQPESSPLNTSLLRGFLNPEITAKSAMSKITPGLSPGGFNRDVTVERPKDYDITKYASKDQIKLWREFGQQVIPGFNIKKREDQEQLADIIDQVSSEFGTSQITYNTLDPTVENLAGLLEGQKTAAMTATINSANKRKADAFYVDPQDPSKVITYKDLIEQYGTKDSQGRKDVEITSVEAVDAANSIPLFLGKSYEAFIDDFRMPVQIQIKTPDGIKKFLQSRSPGDVSLANGDAWRAGKEINQITGKAKIIPGKIESAQLFNGDTDSVFDANIVYMGNGIYGVQEKKTGETYRITEEDLQENIYQKYKYAKPQK